MDKILVKKEKLNVSRTIRIPEKLYEKIAELADSVDVSFNESVNLLLNYAVSNADFIVVDND